MATILLTWELGGGLGHCVKLAPLASGLVARGHHVYFAAHDVATAQRVLQNPRVKYLQSPFTARQPQTSPQPRTFAQVLCDVGFGDDLSLRALVTSWRNLIELVQPQLIICEHSPSALLASRWTGAPRAVIGTGFSLPPDVSPLPDLCPWLDPPATDVALQENRLLDRVNRILADGDRPQLDRLFQLYGDVQDSFLMTFPELDHYPARGATEYMGCWAPSSGVEPMWPDCNGPRVFAYLKSQGPTFRLDVALAVLRELPIRTLAYVPAATKRILNLQSRNLRIVTDPVHMPSTLQQCDFAVVNGTAGTTTQCLLAGIPLVLIPCYMEQVTFCRGVVELGAGIIANPNRLELLAARVWRVLHSKSYRNAARAFANRYASFDPEQAKLRILDRLETLLSSQAVVPAPHALSHAASHAAWDNSVR
jgi:UDP:flavonoid glycosyltransferase YjiC (YdhE family)